MIKRLFCLLFAVLVCTSSVFAWNAESFISDGKPYRFASVSEPAVAMYASDAVPLDDFSSDNLLTSTSPKLTALVQRPYDVETNNLSYTMYSQATFKDVVGSLHSAITFAFPSVTMPAVPADSSYTKYEAAGKVSFYNVPYAYYDFNLPGSGNTVEFNLRLTEPLVRIWCDNSWFQNFLSQVTFECNGTVVKRYTGSIIDETFLYSSSTPVTSVRLILYFGTTGQNYTPSDYAGSYSVTPYFALQGSTFTYSYLSGDSVLDGYTDEAQDNLNQHEQIESEWTGSMTENFNKLDISNFTFPTGLVSGFALITGIFQDIWNAMGEYKIVYVFPLTLGIVLLLIGRISRFAGRGSSRKTDGGGGDA